MEVIIITNPITEMELLTGTTRVCFCSLFKFIPVMVDAQKVDSD